MIWLGAVVVAGATIAAVRRRYLVVGVRGPSMRPTFDHGDQVLVRRVAVATLRRGQVVAVRRTGSAGHILKRIVAAPGDPIPESAAAACGRPAGTPVPAGQLVVYGDGSGSYDSRVWGFVAAENVLGVAVRRLTTGRRSPVANR
jgi:signal peptidase I